MVEAGSAWAALASLRTLTLATVGLDGAPRLRMVVPRGVDATVRRVRFFTDGRSAKVAEIARDARVALLGWQEAARVQWRLDGRAAFAEPVEVAAAWDSVRPGGHLDYATALPPGELLVGPLLRVDAAMARENFAVVDVAVTAIERLQLDPVGHERSRLDWDSAGWSAVRLVP